ncbi:neutral zinc metallopeptidase [Fulvivirgaceae bacterium BMA10]|uniref:Neutral zinc metallopeptidase n=1 Tax=Splendidivirga corallicola TaxID=3051826 RepID=A0ABT8KL21_9BACT|nr:neutral zinc metallopeptidase [Fulvivirgaceae bacterium BMA10]
MRWKGRRQSSHVEDRRSRSRGPRMGRGKVALGGMGTIVILVIMLIMGENPLSLLQGIDSSSSYIQDAEYVPTAEEEELADFVKTVLADTEDVWTKLFREQNSQYQFPTLVLFTGGVQSGCGAASSATGPFYCGADEKVYIDLSFCNELRDRYKAPGDFAVAYVIAHEVGHHIQHLMGISGRVHQMRRQLSQKEYNKLSVKLELQADFLAGVWAHHANKMKNILEDGDIQEALGAANAIGDDRLQKQARGYVVPDSFTHGTSEQRMRWFKLGFTSGDLSKGDTFKTDNL